MGGAAAAGGRAEQHEGRSEVAEQAGSGGGGRSLGVLDVYFDGGADGAGTPAASAEYGWLVGGTDADSLEVWAEGAARVGGSLRRWTPPGLRCLVPIHMWVNRVE